MGSGQRSRTYSPRPPPSPLYGGGSVTGGVQRISPTNEHRLSCHQVRKVTMPREVLSWGYNILWPWNKERVLANELWNWISFSHFFWYFVSCDDLCYNIALSGDRGCYESDTNTLYFQSRKCGQYIWLFDLILTWYTGVRSRDRKTILCTKHIYTVKNILNIYTYYILTVRTGCESKGQDRSILDHIIDYNFTGTVKWYLWFNEVRFNEFNVFNDMSSKRVLCILNQSLSTFILHYNPDR